MFSNIKLTIRNLRRSGVYSVINVVGLAASLATCAFIMMWVQDEKSVDRFHKDAENIYMAVTHFKTDNDEMFVGLSPGPFAPVAKAEFPAVEDFCRVRNWGIGFLRYEDIKTSSINCFYVDTTFFTFFNYPITKGNRDNPFRNPNDVVITERLATTLFGDTDPIGKMVALDDGRVAHVTAVMKEIPKNSYLNWVNADLISSFDIDSTSLSNQSLTVWESTEFYSFVRVKPGTDVTSIAQQLSTKQAEMWQAFRWFLLQPMVNLHLYTLDGKPEGIKTVILFQWIALIIFVIACINYVNLVTARASKRQREIGLKKVIGAKKRQLFVQLISEAVVLFVIAIFIAYGLNHFLLPAYNQLSGKEITINWLDGNLWTVYFTMLVAVVVLAGLYPAYLLASFKASTVVQTIKTKRSNTLFRRTLVVTQFVASTSLITGTIVITAQTKYMRDKDLGYDREHVLISPMHHMSEHYYTVKAELEQQAAILGVTAANDNILNVGHGGGFGDWEGHTNKTGLMFLQMQVDTSFLRVMRLTLTDGTNFTNTFEKQYILNETAIKTMGLTAPVGKWIDKYETKIVGVAKDFHFRNLHYEISPFVMYYEQDHFTHLYVRTRPGNIGQAIASIENIWNRYNADYTFTYSFMDDDFNRMYTSEIRFNRLFSVFSLIAILISCLGLLGLVVFSAELKTKEIGIRKVLGASVFDVVKLLTNEFLVLVGIAMLIAFPLAYFWLDRLLQAFAYRISLSWWMIGGAAVITIALTLLTIGVKAIKAATANPVEAIKN